MTNILHLSKRNLLIGGIVALSLLALAAQMAFAYLASNLRPSSEGSYLQWTPNAGSTHYTRVYEWTSCDGNITYNYTNTVGNRDSYGIYMPIGDGSKITAIAITPCASNNSSSGTTSTMKVFYRFNGVDSADAGNYSLTGTTPVGLSATTFSGLSFIKSPSSALQIGAVYSSGDRGARLSKISTTITYESLGAPSNLVAVHSATSSSQNDLSWTDNSTIEDGFKVEQSVNAQFGPFAQIATTSANVVSYSDTGLALDQTYYYRVRAFNSGGNSGYSSTKYAITATVVPNDPSNLTATVTGTSTDAVLNWTDNSTNEENSKIERSTDGLNFTLIATKGKNVTSHTDSGLTSGTYYYRVYAFNVIGNSGYSNVASVTIP